jgi:hypothetical protein
MNTESEPVEVEALVKGLEKVLDLAHRPPGPLTAHEYLLARDAVWAFTDGRFAGGGSLDVQAPRQPPRFHLVTRLVELRNQIIALRRDAQDAGYKVVPAKIARIWADLSELIDDQRGEEAGLQALGGALDATYRAMGAAEGGPSMKSACARCVSATPPPPAPSRKRPPDFREPTRCNCPPDPAAAAMAGIRRCLDTLAECDRQEAELVRGMIHDVAGLCGLPTKGAEK